MKTWMEKMGRNPETVLGAGLAAVIVAIFVPLPSALLDLLLVASIGGSVLILLAAVRVREPLEFAAFPSVLLVATAFRLSLNVATTRLVLGGAHLEGTNAAGQVVRLFGEMVGGNDIVVGFVVFLILVIVNFVVISKGANRISEVAARFALDALPGKQMAVDAEVAAGRIDAAEAGRRRELIAREADFHGAMDGATKFVKGDAVAGLIITAVNILGGLAIGTLKFGMPLSKALSTFTLLTIGDGLVAQVPALIVALAAGLIMVKGRAPSAAAPAAPAPSKGGPTMEELLRVEPMELEVGVGLIRCVQAGLADRIAALRRDLASDLGLVIPSVRLRDTMDRRPNAFAVRIRGVEAARGEVKPGTPTPDAVAFIVGRFREVVLERAADLLTRDDVDALLKVLKETRPAVVAEVVPAVVKPGELQRVLQSLLREGVPIRDLGTILEAVGDAAGRSTDPAEWIETARASLAGALCRRHAAEDGTLYVVAVDPKVEERIAPGAEGSLGPEEVERLAERLGVEVGRQVEAGHAPVVLCGPRARSAVKRLADAVRTGVSVMSTRELVRDVRVQPLAMVGADPG